MPDPDARASLDVDIVNWITETTTARVTRLERMTGGNRRQSWLVDVDEGGQSRGLFLRYAPGADADDPFTIRREASVYRALDGTDVAMPRMLALHPTREAMLLERAPGNGVYPSSVTSPASGARPPNWADADDLDRQREQIARNFVEALATLHAQDPGALPVEGLGDPRAPVADHVRGELDLWEALYRSTASLDPMVELGLRWLRDHVPTYPSAAVIVHGDAGPGNFLFDDANAITALVDWEFCHLGDPVEDLAWFAVRQAYMPVPDMPERFREYEAASGRAIEYDRLVYYYVLVLLRIVIIRHRASGEAERTGDVAASLLSRCLSRRLFVEALAEASGAALPVPVVPDATDGQVGALVDAALLHLETSVLPAADGGVLTRALGNLQFVLTHLRSADRRRMVDAVEDLAHLRRLLPFEVADLPTGLQALALQVRDGRLDLPGVLAFLHGQACRETEQMRDAMGALADSHLPSPGGAVETRAGVVHGR